MNTGTRVAIILAITLIVILIGGGAFFYFQQQNKGLTDDKVIAQVGKLIDLPQGEIPQVATVTDVEKLRSQPFFQKAKNGDKVLIYQQASKAYLFDPKANKLLDVAPLTASASAQQPSDTQPSPEASNSGTPQ